MKWIFIAVTALSFFSLHAQVKDFIVTKNGDTLKGKISVTGNNFLVQEERTGKLSGIAPDDIRYLHVKKYKGTVAVHCHLYTYTDNVQQLEYDDLPLSSIDTTMILQEIYSTPKMNLYYGTDATKSQYYFYKTPADSTPVQLVVFFTLGGGLSNYRNDPMTYHGMLSQTFLQEIKGYVNQLHAIMGNCPNISSGMWEVLSYRDYSLKELIRRFNKCE